MAAFSRVADAVAETEPRRLATQVIETFREHQLLIAAGGIAFRVLLAIVTGTLCLLGLLGFFDLTEVWRTDVAPDLRSSVSDDVFRVIDQAVTHVLQDKAFYWVTVGAAIAIWQISGVVRSAGQTLNRVYDVKEERTLVQELVSSLIAGAVIGLLLLATVATVRLTPLAIDALIGDSWPVAIGSFLARWTVAAALLLGAVAIVVRAGPSIDRPAHWVSFGAALTVGGWVVLSLLLGVYMSEFASFGSVYGTLLALFLAVESLYFAAVVFLGGLVVDRLIEQRESG